MDFDLENYKTQGVKINYYYLCKRKLWLFSKGITMEHLSDRVLSGKVLHENAYSRQKSKEIVIDDIIKLDIMTEILYEKLNLAVECQIHIECSFCIIYTILKKMVLKKREVLTM